MLKKKLANERRKKKKSRLFYLNICKRKLTRNRRNNNSNNNDSNRSIELRKSSGQSDEYLDNMNSSNVNANDSSAMAVVDSSLTSSMGGVSPPMPIAKSVSVTSFLSDTGSFSPNQPVEFDQTMETFLENARFGRYDNVLETLNRYNGLMQTTTITDIDVGSASSSSSSSDLLKQNFDINYRGKSPHNSNIFFH